MLKINVLGQDRPQQNSEFEFFNEACKYHRHHAVRDSKPIADHLHAANRLLEVSNNYKKFYSAQEVKLECDTDLSQSRLLDCLQKRRSCRHFSTSPLDFAQMSSLLNISFGATRLSSNPAFSQDRIHMRSYPSAGALYPVETYVIPLNVTSQPAVCAHYSAIEKHLSIVRHQIDIDDVHDMFMLKDGTADTALIVVFAGVFMRSTAKYQSRGYRFTLMEAGHMAQNLCLTAAAMGLGSLAWSSYYDDEVNELIGIDGVAESAVHCVLLGHPKEKTERGE